MIRSIRSPAFALILGAALAAPAIAAPNPPQNGYPTNQDIGAVITNTIRTVGTVIGTPSINNLNWRGVVCSFLVSASSASGTETFSIEGYDAAINAWYPIATTGAIAFNPYVAAGVKTLAVYPGVATSSLSSTNAAQSAVLPRVWRLKDVVAAVGGPNPAVTSKAGCNLIN